MKTYPFISSRSALVCAALLGAASLKAQEPAPVTPPPVVEDAPTVADAPEIGADQLEELVGPIALYPDALIALILPASTVSSDIVLAARFLKGGETLTEIDSQPWDDSVKGLAHYPDVVKWLDENLSWTQQLGEAYLAEPQAVMDAIQRARALARSNGVLTDTPQQRVVIEDNYIRIIPTKPDVIYVPRYDPEIIYVQRPLYYYPDPWLSFGIGFGVGSWLSYDLDWRTHRIWVNHDPHHWRHHRDWRHRHFPGRPGYVHHGSHWRHWTPSVNRPRPPHRDGHHRWGRDFARPSPLPGAPRFDRERWIKRDRRDHFSGGGRPGVIRPDRDRTRDVQRDSSRDGQQDRRAEWRNRDRTRDGQPRSDRPDRRSFGRERAESSVSNNAAPSNSQIAPTPTPQGQRSIGSQRQSRERVNRPSGDSRFSQRRSESVSPSPSVDRRHITPPTRAQSGFRENVQRQNSTQRRDYGQFRQASPSSQRPAAIASRPAPAVARPAPVAAAQVRTAPQHREYRHAPRVAQPDRVSPPAPAASAPAARSVEAPRSRGGDHGSRPAASYGGRGEGRGSRGNRAER